jgi:hypothetical protein
LRSPHFLAPPGGGAAGAWVDAAGGGLAVAGSGRVARFVEPGLMTVGAGFDASGACGVSGFVDSVVVVDGCTAFSSGFVRTGSGPCGVIGFVVVMACRAGCTALGSDDVPAGAVCANAAVVASATRAAAAYPPTDDEDRGDMKVLLEQVDRLHFLTGTYARSDLAAVPVTAARGRTTTICGRALIACG